MTTRTRSSLDEYLSLEETKPYLEFIDGEVVARAMPNAAHAALTAEIIADLINYARIHTEWRVSNELRHLHRDDRWVFLPDVSVTSRAKLRVQGPGKPDPVEVMPDFAIEVLSPDDRPGVVMRRVAHYLQAGVRLLWLIDPDEEQITVWQPGESPKVVTPPATLSADTVLPGFEIDTVRLFASAREA